MPENARRVLQADRVFFGAHPDRRFHIRIPMLGEYEQEFRSLGPHILQRRRIIVARVDKARAGHFGVPFARIPFLQFADETIEDDDSILKPLFEGIMRDAAAAEGREVVF